MTEAATIADFSAIRYAQCWEDADVLVKALEPSSDHVCLSIASAGDNALALLAKGPAKVIAVDLNPAQLACLELRVAAYRQLEYPELLKLIGSRPSHSRIALYQRCRKLLSPTTADFWDAHPFEINQGIGSSGKFERYFQWFRTRLMPLIHSQKRIDQLLAGGDLQTRKTFYEREWNTWRWRLLFRIFFSRFIMGRFGRDPVFFRYVEGNVADRILSRTYNALTELDPNQNPYLQWILTGKHTTALPFALRPENFDPIRQNLANLEWFQGSLEDYLDANQGLRVDRYNLSDIFEYMSPENYKNLLHRLVAASRPGARLAYWNMLVPRSRPETMSHQLRSLETLAQQLFDQDKAWFYSRFVLEEVIG